ncbi:RNA polymerase sigma-70 factor [uncultured Chitinophaga sp.]|uniref:RNA polymerase sigma-70 factor n=1 Tax=uncultured Chitinophaga sp. TaxID=339340 RepID=UPI0025F91ECD|nr:RNA polymerase sigma-70 factor [uncultured Chitinophaga sp.]
MSEKLVNEKELLACVGQSDERAFEKIVHHYFPRLLPFTTNITKNRAVAEEIVQEVFLRLWQHRHEHERIYHLGSWLFTIASNLSLTYLKKMAVEGKLLKVLQNSQESNRSETEERLQFKESGLLIHEAINRLPPQQQQVYRMSRYEGLSTPEIAERLQLSPNTVKNHLVRALQTIRSFIRTAGFTILL